MCTVNRWSVATTRARRRRNSADSVVVEHGNQVVLVGEPGNKTAARRRPQVAAAIYADA